MPPVTLNQIETQLNDLNTVLDAQQKRIDEVIDSSPGLKKWNEEREGIKQKLEEIQKRLNKRFPDEPNRIDRVMTDFGDPMGYASKKILWDQDLVSKEAAEWIQGAMVLEAHSRLPKWRGALPDAAEIKAAYQEDTDAEGGFLVPIQFQAELLRLTGEAGVAFPRVRRFPMTVDEMQIPRLLTDVTVDWVDEETLIPESEATFERPNFVVKKLGAHSIASNEQLEDSAIQMIPLIIELFAQKFAEKKDFVILDGVAATDNYDGILHAAGVNETVMGATKTAFTDTTWENLSDVMTAIVASAKTRAAWWMHRDIINIVRKITDSNGQFIWQPPSGGRPSNIWGYPLVEAEQAPDISKSAISREFVAFGDMQYYAWGDRQRMTTEASRHVKFLNHQTVIKVIERLCFGILIPAAFSRLKTAAA